MTRICSTIFIVRPKFQRKELFYNKILFLQDVKWLYWLLKAILMAYVCCFLLPMRRIFIIISRPVMRHLFFRCIFEIQRWCSSPELTRPKLKNSFKFSFNLRILVAMSHDLSQPTFLANSLGKRILFHSFSHVSNAESVLVFLNMRLHSRTSSERNGRIL